MHSSKILYIWHSILFNNEHRRFYEIYSQHNSIEKCYEFIRSGKAISLNEIKYDFDEVLKISYDIESFCERNNIHILSPCCESYPQKLMNIDCPPIIFYAKGDINLLKSHSNIAIVGARKANDYSLHVCREFSSRLTKSGYVITSGFAGGIDHEAHKSCIESGGKTIAVLGGGILYDYPKNSSSFRNEVANNGLLLSEYPPLEKPVPENFPIRNRIISALSDGVLIVQAAEKSGSISTATHGIEQGRDIFVIPPTDIFSPVYSGQARLIQDGANIVFEPEDITDLYK